MVAVSVGDKDVVDIPRRERQESVPSIYLPLWVSLLLEESAVEEDFTLSGIEEMTGPEDGSVGPAEFQVGGAIGLRVQRWDENQDDRD